MPAGDLSKKERQLLKLEVQAAEARHREEIASWVDDDKKTLAKLRRAEEREAKADARLTAKKEKKDLEAQEEENATSKNKNAQTAKITQAEIARRKALGATTNVAPRRSAASRCVEMPPLEENMNRNCERIDGSGLDDALSALQGARPAQRTTFSDFEKRMIDDLRASKPSLKMSQIKDHVMKAWARSPENPRNLC